MSFTPDRTARVAKRKARIDEGVASGRLTQEQGQKRIANMDKRNQRRDQIGTEVRGAYEKARSAAQKFGKGNMFDKVSQGAMGEWKRASGGDKPRIAQKVREADSGGSDYDPESSYNEPNVSYGGTGGGYLDNMDMVNSVTGNYFEQNPTHQAGYYAPPEDDPNEQNFTGAGPSNTQARDAKWNNSFVNEKTGGYQNDEAARAAFATPYYATTKQNPKNKTTSPGKLDDDDIIALNNYQYNLEQKQKTKGLNAKEAAQLNDYYRREEYYRTRGGYEDEPAEEKNKVAGPPTAKAAAPTGKGSTPPDWGPGGYDPKNRPVKNGKFQEEDGSWSPLSKDPPKGGAKVAPATGAKPIKQGTTPKAGPTASGSYTGGSGGTGGSTAKGTNTTLPAKKTPAQQSAAAAASIKTAQKYPKGNEAKQLAATLKKYPQGEIARQLAAQNAAKPPANKNPKPAEQPKPAGPGPKVQGNPTYKPGYGPAAKAPAGSGRAAPNTGGAAKSPAKVPVTVKSSNPAVTGPKGPASPPPKQAQARGPEGPPVTKTPRMGNTPNAGVQKQIQLEQKKKVTTVRSR